MLGTLPILQDTLMKMKRTLFALAAVAFISTSAHAAIEIHEEDFGPTYGSAALDITIAKPLQFVGAVAGTALHVIGLPFSAASGSVDSSYETLVVKPWQALSRCVGCSEAYDIYRNTHEVNPNEVRITVDRPSEIIINTDQNVVVNPR